MLGRRFRWMLLFPAWLLATCAAPPVEQRGHMTASSPRFTSPESVNQFLQAHVGPTTTTSDVEALMKPHARSSGWVHLGGTGARQQVFQLSGDLRAVFQFDGRDRLVAYGAYQATDPWPGGE